IARQLKPSRRGELEITDVNRAYLESGDLHVKRLGRGIAWLDTGTHESLQQASAFIQVLQERQGLMVACLEEIAWRLGWITSAEVAAIAQPMRHNGYGRYLLQLLEWQIPEREQR
ncbi:MAG: sugar phosphate nucleotidyltransferase, partial [Acidobacteriota bacterium]